MNSDSNGGISPESVLFVTLDSCRYDTFMGADAGGLNSVGPVHKAHAPSHFTFGSHAAMFVGFTPGVPGNVSPYLNPKVAKIFKITGPGFAAKGGEAYALDGADIIDGFRNAGFATFGTGAVGWFNPATPASRQLTRNFDEFHYTGRYWSIQEQVKWLGSRIEALEEGRPCFAFLNAGETHAPYYFEGAAWSSDDNPCVPFQTIDRAAECRMRQRACLEEVDRHLAPLIAAFEGSTTVVCGDHGDCWGEDGLWEHGISHPMTLTVPLLVRVRGRPVGHE